MVPEPTVSSRKQLTCVEENAIRYTGGSVLRKILKKYECQKTDVAHQCVTALKEMVGKLSSCQRYDRSCEYVNSIDCGGLYHIQDPVNEMFVAIELIVNSYRTSVTYS